MARRIYWIVLFISLIGGVLFYFIKDGMETGSILSILFVISMLFVGSFHGIIAHSLNPRMKGGLIGYPILMGLIFAILFFFFVFVVMPLFEPGFLEFWR